MEYPCKECTKTPEQQNSHCKECGDWKNWFMDEWAKVNACYERLKKEIEDG